MRPITLTPNAKTILGRALLASAVMGLAACEPSGGVGNVDPSPNATLEQQINEPTDGLANEITTE